MKYSFLVFVSLIAVRTYGQNISEIDHYKTLCNNFRFEDYKVIEPVCNVIAKLDTLIFKDFSTKAFSTILNQYNNTKTSNFSGCYIIVTWGCGSPCQMNAIIDSRTGQVKETFSTSNGLTFKKNSNLVIIDPPTEIMFDKQYRDLIGPPKFLVWKDGKLNKLKE